MKLKFKNEYANIFLARLQERFPKYTQDIEVHEYEIGFVIDLEIKDETHENPLSISMWVNYNEITVGHDFNDHEHFVLDENLKNDDFINQAFEYIDTICLSRI